jgi:hypothetical protein
MRQCFYIAYENHTLRSLIHPMLFFYPVFVYHSIHGYDNSGSARTMQAMNFFGKKRYFYNPYPNVNYNDKNNWMLYFIITDNEQL